MDYIYASAGDVAELQDLEGIFQNIISSLLALAGIALFITLLLGGFKFISSGGNPKNLESAKQTLTWAIIGIILVALSYMILFLISEITGNKNILNFRITF